MTEIDFHLAEVRPPLDPQAQWGTVWDGIAGCSLDFYLDRFGYDDLADDDIRSNLVRYAPTPEREQLWLVALRGPRPVGTPDGRYGGVRLVTSEPGPEVRDPGDVWAAISLEAPLLDNHHLLEAGPLVLRSATKNLGIEDAAPALVERIARELGRDTILSWVSHHGAELNPADPAALVDPTGAIGLRRSEPDVARLVSNGYSLAQVERHSVQPIPIPDEVLRPACETGRAEAAGYELLQWTGRSAEEHLDDLAVLAAAMATDPPLGEVDWRPEVWDAARVQKTEQRANATGVLISSAARHRASGRLVGMTQLSVHTEKPTVAYQWSTIVLSEHRGHGLGLLLKAANARLLHEHRPEVLRVHTYNADENAPMLRVNTALGYRREGVEGCWQKVLA